MVAVRGGTEASEFADAVHEYCAAQALTVIAQAVFAAAENEPKRAAALAVWQEANARRLVAWERLRTAFDRRGSD